MVLLTVVACEKVPGGQVVAVVASEEITRRDVTLELGAHHDRADPQARADSLERLVDRAVLAEHARQISLDRTPMFVAKERRVMQALLATEAIRDLSKIPVTPSDSATRRFISENPLIFAQRRRLTLDQIRLEGASAGAHAARLRRLGSIDDVSKVLRASQVRFVRATTILDTAAADSDVLRQLAAKGTGELFVTDARGGVVIGGVVDAVDAVAPQDTWLVAARALLRQRAVDDALDRAIADLRRDTRIVYASVAGRTE